MNWFGSATAGPNALPGEVQATRVLGRLGDEAQLLQRLDHLDAERPDRDVGAVGQRLRRAHDVLLVAEPYGDEGVGRAEVRVLAEAEDGHALAAVCRRR